MKNESEFDEILTEKIKSKRTLREGEEKDTHGLKSKEKDVKKDGVVPFKRRKIIMC